MKINIIIMICIVLAFNLTGCWSSHELNNFAFVMGVAIDKGTENGNILLTAQTAKPAELKSNSGGGSSEKAYWNIKNEGETIFSTVRGYTHESGRKLNWQHIKIVILSREIAEEGVQQYLDFFVRDHEPRISAWIFVAKDKAGDILDVEPELDKIPAINIDKLAEAQQFTGETYTIRMLDFLNCLLSKTTAPITALIEVSGEGEEQKILMSGAAVFKKDKLVGELNKAETRGLMWVAGEVKSGIIVVDCPGVDGKVEFEIFQASSTITPEIKDGNIHITVIIKEQGNIGAQTCTENLATSEMFKILKNEQSSVIRDEIIASVKKAQELNADIFGFGEAVHRKYPDQWKDFEGKWDDIFPNIEIEIIVEAKLYGAGQISKPANSEKE